MAKKNEGAGVLIGIVVVVLLFVWLKQALGVWFWVLLVGGVLAVLFAILHARRKSLDSGDIPHVSARIVRSEREPEPVCVPAVPPSPATFFVPEMLEYKRAIRNHPSESKPDVTYRVDLANLTCTCPDYERRRGLYHGRDVRLLCKHLCRSVGGALPNDTPELVWCMLTSGYPMRDFLEARELSTGDDAVFGVSPGNNWIDVYARKRRPGDPAGSARGPFNRAGFNVATRKWAYGSPAYPAREVEGIIDRILGQYQ